MDNAQLVFNKYNKKNLNLNCFKNNVPKTPIKFQEDCTLLWHILSRTKNNHNIFWLSRQLAYLLPKSNNLFCFRPWTYLMKDIPETRHAHWIRYIRLYCSIRARVCFLIHERNVAFFQHESLWSWGRLKYLNLIRPTQSADVHTLKTVNNFIWSKVSGWSFLIAYHLCSCVC
jgi:hypothetical protein